MQSFNKANLRHTLQLQEEHREKQHLLQNLADLPTKAGIVQALYNVATGKHSAPYKRLIPIILIHKIKSNNYCGINHINSGRGDQCLWIIKILLVVET